MKRFFIFAVLVAAGFGCAHHKETGATNPDLIVRATAEEWRSSSPGEDELTEHGVDLTIEMNNSLSNIRFLYTIYNGRKSFPATVDSTASNNLSVQARILYESSLMAQTSDRTNLSDRLVFQNSDGETDYIPVNSWIENPVSYR